MILKSIRWKIQAWHGLLLFLVLSGFGFTAYRVAWDNQMRRIDRELEQKVTQAFRPPPPPDDEHGPKPGGVPRGGHGLDADRMMMPHGEAPEFRSRMREWVQRETQSLFDQTNSVYFVVWQPDGTVVARSASAPADVPFPDAPQPMLAKKESGGTPFGNARKFLPGPGMSTSLRTRGEFREAYRFMP